MSKRITDEELLNAIMVTSTKKEASELLGVSEQTVCKRTQTPAFKTLLSDQRRSVYDLVSNRVVQSSMRALDTLLSLLDSDSEMMRYNAASRILSLSQQYISSQDILLRIDNLEESMTVE